jgi:hypothetical protein
MVPGGYMAKRVAKKADWLKAARVEDIYSVSGCISNHFADYIEYWKHNGYWIFDSPEIILGLAKEHSISMEGTSLFYYELFELEFDGRGWRAFLPEQSFVTNVSVPLQKQLEGFDVVTFWARNAPECSPLSCNSLAGEIPTNVHCLMNSFKEAEAALNGGAFENCEPGPYRIMAVYSVDRP